MKTVNRFVDSFSAAANILDGTVTESLIEIAEKVLPAYIPRAHTTYLAERITEGVRRAAHGEEVRLAISLPPGAGKSATASVSAPLYVLRQHPNWPCAIVSGDKQLALKFSRDVRRAILENKVPITLADRSGSVAAGEWETAQHGGLLATGRSSGLPGRRIRCLFFDDPTTSLADAYSLRSREQAWEMWQGVIKPRLWQGGNLVCVISTRWHQDDLIGRLLNKQTDDAPWEEIRIPAIAENGDPLGREPGEPLLSPQVNETVDDALKRWARTRQEVGEYVWHSLYQQRPSPPGGAVFNSDWWQYYTPEDKPPSNQTTETITSWDLAFGTENPETGDYVVGTVWEKTDGLIYLLDMVRGRWQFTEQIEQIKKVAERFPQATVHVVEKAANGAAAVDTLRRVIPGIVGQPAQGPKIVRAHAVSPMVEAGQVFLPKKASWLDVFLTEATSFPAGKHDDIVDSVSQGLRRLVDGHTATFYSETSDEVPGGRKRVGGGMAGVVQGGY